MAQLSDVCYDGPTHNLGVALKGMVSVSKPGADVDVLHDLYRLQQVADDARGVLCDACFPQ